MREYSDTELRDAEIEIADRARFVAEKRAESRLRLGLPLKRGSVARPEPQER